MGASSALKAVLEEREGCVRKVLKEFFLRPLAQEQAWFGETKEVMLARVSRSEDDDVWCGTDATKGDVEADQEE
jgi:hypothetical protein